MMRRSALKSCTLLMLTVAALSAGVLAQQKDTSAEKADAAKLPARIWRDPGDVASLDLISGAGGRAHAPDPTGTFTFVKEDALGTTPKFDVADGQGVAWKVKLGEESQSEIAATRFLWAAGYFADEDYYMAELRVKGLPPLKRGQALVSSDGVIRCARLERKLTTVKKLGNWDWFDNPFVGQRELNGLRVMMSFLNNWDLKTINNSIDEVDGERRFVVSDVGATFGRTGNSLMRSKSNPKDDADSKFVEKATPQLIDFVLHSRPFFLSAINVPNYRTRTRMEQITAHIPRADAKWLGDRLSGLSDDQIRDCFRAAGYGPGEIEVYTNVARKRIAELGAL